ncbi:LuxR family transcriptional regulator [Streptomyces populi]|uniref:LuxR family transcriptional regulator n=1 Tax=Streptomyces populi TaxID=2058924 RepID=A0A2I0SC01_9ACTN|nr:helix-turn-helix transcriptional regulator [Streptomyces populi]PKT67458.1 LuxR family transcriptional regulator [Streptomyces populi]
MHATTLSTPRGGSPVPSDLAPREQEALSYIALGFTHSQTARRMGISPYTVNTYLRRIRAKYGLDNRAQLVRLAFELQL